MALHRGIQSAIFYYLSCAPCSDARYRKKRKREAVQDRAERELLESQIPNLYRHPSPSSTNPHWQAEISLGPTLPYRGKRKIQTAESQKGLKQSTTQSSHGSNIASSVDLPRSSDSDDRHDSKWNFRPYQRDDDQLWGSNFSDLPLRNYLDGCTPIDGLAKPARVRTAESTSSSTYRTFRNPAVNDLHPAIVTRVETRDEVAWMMQPPPVAEIMSGKERVPRSRSDSGGSRPSSNSVKLSRQVSARLIEKKMRTTDSNMPPALNREISERSATSAPRSVGDRNTDEMDFAHTPRKRSKSKSAPLQISDSTDSADTVIHQPDFTTEQEQPQQIRKKPSRPPLSTILSESSDIPKLTDSRTPSATTPKENAFPTLSPAIDDDDLSQSRDRIARRAETLGNDVPLKMFQDTEHVPVIFDSHIFVQSPGSINRLQAPDDDHRRSTAEPEFLDTWHTPGFELDKWVHEHTKREVRQRWSMDL